MQEMSEENREGDQEMTEEQNEKMIALRAATLNRYYTAMLQASIMGLMEFVGFDENEILDCVTDMLTQLDEAKKHYEGVV